jgi:hypothetical protein
MQKLSKLKLTTNPKLHVHKLLKAWRKLFKKKIPIPKDENT